MVIPRECHTEWAKSDRKGEISYDIPSMWNLKRNDTNKLIKQKETHRLRNDLNGCRGEGRVRDFGKIMYTLLYLQRITNEDLLYSSWNSAQCYMPAWMGRGSGENGYIHMYGWVPWLFTWKWHNILNWLCPNKKCFGVKKREKKVMWSWIQLELIILREVSQKKQTNIIWCHLYGEYRKMMQMNSFTKQKQAQT